MKLHFDLDHTFVLFIDKKNGWILCEYDIKNQSHNQSFFSDLMVNEEIFPIINTSMLLRFDCSAYFVLAVD